MNPSGTVLLNTERLVLCRHQIKDAEGIFRNWATDPKTCRFYDWETHSDISVTRSLLEQWIAEYDDPFYFHWSIIIKKEKSPIGTIYFSDLNTEENSAVINYLLGSRWWGRGYATEAARRVLEYGFNHLNLTRISAHHHVENPASGAVLRKCGFVYKKTIFRDYPGNPLICGDYAHWELLRN